MRNKLVLSLVLLTSLAWAVAQQQSSTPSAPAPDPGQQTQNTPPTPGRPTSPSAPSAMGQSAAPAGEPDLIEGCLGGAAPNFTVTDNAGTAYRLDIPAGADASVLSKHVGESVQVIGDVSKGSTSAGAEAGAAKGASIAVQKIGRGKGTCSGSPNNGSTATKPPSQ